MQPSQDPWQPYQGPDPYGATPPPPANWQQGYGYPPQYPVQYPVARPTNGLAIGALVASLVFAPLGIVLGHVALSQIKKNGDEGRGLAIAGLIIGYVLTVLGIITWIIIIAFINAVNDYEYDDEYDYYSSLGSTSVSVPAASVSNF
ncbi:DUF4190 domain-containing protein [Williamsia sp. 1135]|uniref:DUF4190 domain-containing protein n=1 Tax=Williamsia sp. 1135 TaxID=1889262 RepID=UPI000A10DA1F|nr:DUF4190 domain-containing protein [Williamsia sp. 1135]ORM30114.1 hypothetical protein BFL43_18800 [Williamsia sp. 1135]